MSFQNLFYPTSIAVVGASRKEKTVGNDLVKNLVTQGYKGGIYPVNPHADELYGIKVFHSINSISNHVDLAIIAIPAKAVLDAVRELGEKGTKAVVVISAGFGETGNNDLEKQLMDLCESMDITLIGPNCLGVLNPEISMNASFAALMPATGNVALISQSGALCATILDYARKLNIGFSKFISIGNKAAVKELDFIRYFKNDPVTKVIALYAEQLENAPELIKEVREITQSNNPKPVIIIKSGKTEEGVKAIASHTGSLGGGDTAYEALFNQAGIIRANSIEELFDYVQIFSHYKFKKVRNIAIVTNAGGPGIVATDSVIDNGLELSSISESTKKSLKDVLPDASSVNNPIDILGDAKSDRYKQSIEILITDPNVDSLLVILTPQSMTDIEQVARSIIEIRKTTDKPIIASFMGNQLVEGGVKLLEDAGVITTPFPEPAIKALAAMGRFVGRNLLPTSEFLHYDDVDSEKVRNIFAEARKQNKTAFPEVEALEILRAYNFSLLKTGRARSVDEAIRVIQELTVDNQDGKFAMKIISPEILHKSDVGGVLLNVTASNINEKYQQLMQNIAKNKPNADIGGVLLMEMSPDDGIEVILGVKKEQGMGTTIMFGIGGIYVEVLKDVNFAFTPLTKRDAERMIDSLKSSKVFEGVRGQKPADRKMMIESIGRLSQLVNDFPEILELDINPLMVFGEGEGVKVLDARLILEDDK